MPDLPALSLEVNAVNFQLGNEVTSRAGATFVHNRDTPDSYDSNHVTAIAARTPAEIDELLAAADREFAYTNHRRFDIDFRTPPEFIARLTLDGGYERTDALVSVLEGELIGKAARWDIRPLESEADWEAHFELMLLDWLEMRKRQGKPPAEEVARQIWTANRRKQPPVQYWLACQGERPIGYMNAWEGTAGVGQVEDLFVHPDNRNRGAATALIHHCVAESRRRGASPVVIVADPTDTPKNIYARMGFRPVAVATKLLRRLTPD